jgi:VCBS repeat-containing protein
LSAVLVEDTKNGTLQLDPDGSFTYTPNLQFIGTDTFTYRANDGALDSNLVTVTLNVSEVNLPPEANDDAYSVDEDTVLNVAAAVGVLANDTDANGDVLTASRVSGPDHGSLQLNFDGSFTYTPEADFFGSDTFMYRAGDGEFETALTTVAITVNPINDAPVAVDDVFQAAANGTLTILGLSVDAFVTPALNFDASTPGSAPASEWQPTDAGTSTARTWILPAGKAPQHVALPAGSTSTSLTHAYRYEQGAFAGADSSHESVNASTDSFESLDSRNSASFEIWFRPTDLNNGKQVLFETGAWEVGMTIGLNNDQLFVKNLEIERAVTLSPNLIDDFIQVVVVFDLESDVTALYVNGGLLAGGDTVDTGLGGAPVAWSGTNAAGLGDRNDVTTNAQKDDNEAAGGFAISDSDKFNYGAFDGDIAIFRFYQDDALSAEQVAQNYRAVAAGSAAGVLANDFDGDGDSLAAALVEDGQYGTLQFNTAGTFTYTPDVDFIGTDTFTYRASDGALDSNLATVTLNVVDVNFPPTADDDTYSVDEDGVLDVAAGAGVLIGDSDPNGDVLTATLATGPANGTLLLSGDGSFTYTPDENFFGTDTFSYRAGDGEFTSSVAIVTINVSPINDAPVAQSDFYSVESGEDLASSGGVLSNDDDVEGDLLSAVLVDDVDHGTLQLNSDGTFSYTPEAGFVGNDSFTYRASDGQLPSNLATVTIRVEGPPVAGDDEYEVEENQTLVVGSADGVLANDSDGNGDAITAKVSSSPQHGNLSLNSSGAFTYTPDVDFFGTDSFTYTPSDGEYDGEPATVTIVVGRKIIDVALVALGQPSAGNSLGTLPSSLSQIAAGTTYFVEVWIQDIDQPGVGISGGTIDLGYNSAPADVAALSHGGLFNLLTTGLIDDAIGLINDFGGGTFQTSVGTAPTWARLGYIEVAATAAGPVTFTLDEGRSAFSRSGLGNVPWNKVDLSKALTVDQVGGLVQFDMTAVRQPTDVDPLGHATALPASAAFLHEWESYWVELWLSTPDDVGIGVAGGTLDFAYDTSRFTATRIEHGAAFTDQTTGTIDDGAGLIRNLGGLTTRGGIGDAQPALLARILFEPTDADEAEVDEVGHNIGPYDLGLGLSNLQFPGPDTRISPTPATALWAVPYDVDDNGLIDLGDFSFFAPAFEQTVGEAEPPFAWWADFDRSGLVDFGDFSFFVANVNRRKPDSAISFPSNFGQSAAPSPAGSPAAVAAPGVGLEVQLVALDTLSVGDAAAALPASLSAVSDAQIYFVEVWLRDNAPGAPGITGGRVDLQYTSSAADVVSAANSDQYSVFANSSVDEPAGLVSGLGGGTFDAGVASVDEWARIGYVQLTATGGGPVRFTLREGDLQLSRFGQGNIPWDEVSLGTLSLNSVPADLTGNGFVDFQDLTILLANWNQSVSAAEGNLVDAGGTPVNFQDLTVLLAAWTGPGPAASPQAAAAEATAQRDTTTTESNGATSVHFDRLGRREHVSSRRANRISGTSSNYAPLRRLQAVAVDRALEDFALNREMIVRRTTQRDRRR